jgi:hypothetical protein
LVRRNVTEFGEMFGFLIQGSAGCQPAIAGGLPAIFYRMLS